jgi:hypothetical protein
MLTSTLIRDWPTDMDLPALEMNGGAADLEGCAFVC